MRKLSKAVDRPVFDVANDNGEFWLPAFREELEDLNDEPAAPHRARTAAERSEARARAASRRAEDTAGIERQKARIEQRCRPVPTANNDNDVFPLLTTLKRDGAVAEMDLVVRYRALVALCNVEPLQAQDVSPAGDLRPDRKSTKLDVSDVDAAAAKGFPDPVIAGGEIRHKEVRQAKGGTFDISLKRKGAADTETGTAHSIPTSFKFTDAVLIASIDAKPILAELRAAMGPLLDAFEDAVLGGQTLAQVGSATGARVKPEIAGRALVMTAIDVLRDTWRQIAARERRLALAAERNVERRRGQLAERRASYLGLAA